MNQVNIQFNSDGFREVLLSPGTESAVRSAAETIRARANSNVGSNSDGFTVSTWQGGYGGGRWIASVTGSDNAANRAESENKALSGAII